MTPTTATALKLRVNEIPQKFRNEEEKLEYLLKGQLGPISWALHFERLLEIRGVLRETGPKAQVDGGISPTVGLIAEELGVPRSTAFRRLQWARELKSHPRLALAVDRGEMSPRSALREIGAGHRASKPDLGNGVSHPARFSAEHIEIFAEVLEGYKKVLDPFAGTGRIHELEEWGHLTTGIEIEPEWAELHKRTELGDALDLRFKGESFDAICTSPAYGNRMADAHNAKDAETRRSYTHDLGHPLHPNNSGRLQWGPKYREFHEQAWDEVARVLKFGGRFVLNIKDHIRKGKWQYVAGWHVTYLVGVLGLDLLFHVEVEAAGMKAGSNGDLRCPEYIYVLEKRDE
ncbi:MAG: hypothetical protein ACRD1T_12545 [Acidimicrobiia bacterium]